MMLVLNTLGVTYAIQALTAPSRWGYASANAAKKPAGGIGVPKPTGGHTAFESAVFLCPQHGRPVMGGPCGGDLGRAGSCRPVRQRRTVPPSLIGVGEAEIETATTGAIAMAYPTPTPSVQYVAFPRYRQPLARYRFRVPGTTIHGDIIAASRAEALRTFCNLHHLTPDTVAAWSRLPMPGCRSTAGGRAPVTADLFGSEVC